MNRVFRMLAIHALAALLALPMLAGAALPRPPGQPVKGPGGRQRMHDSVTMARHGLGGSEYWLYTPADPVPSSAPVVVFLHGWGGMDPVSYGAWIEHLVLRGNIVIYPRYQASLLTPPTEMTENALAAVNDALVRLAESGVKPQVENLAIIGHSLGGVIAANLACEAATGRLPLPKALVLVEPGDSKNSKTAQAFGLARDIPSIMRDYTTIPKDTLMLCIVGAEDQMVGSGAARTIFYGATAVSRGNKDFVVVNSDRRGSPQLIADHFAPLAPDERYRGERHSRLRDRLRDKLGKYLPVADRMERASVDALDYYCFWKLADALIETAFHGVGREYALGCTYEQKNMGKWSDGVPVVTLDVTDAP